MSNETNHHEMKYTVYACELVSDDYFIKGNKVWTKSYLHDLAEAKRIAKIHDKKQKEKRRKGWSFVYIFHLVYEENGFLAK